MRTAKRPSKVYDVHVSQTYWTMGTHGEASQRGLTSRATGLEEKNSKTFGLYSQPKRNILSMVSNGSQNLVAAPARPSLDSSGPIS